MAGLTFDPFDTEMQPGLCQAIELATLQLAAWECGCDTESYKHMYCKQFLIFSVSH